jgi:metal-responsive CopG/Arc/MetJ family transcriptional regulator
LSKEGFVDIQVRNVPVQLLEEFDKVVVKRFYPGGRSEAVRALMRKFIRDYKEG